MYDDSEKPTADSGGRTVEPSSSKAAAPVTLCRCAYCGKKFERASTPVMPFCSTRCHQIDLGMWLNESYGLPWDGEADPEATFE